jgi:hypothetical protein
MRLQFFVGEKLGKMNSITLRFIYLNFSSLSLNFFAMVARVLLKVL